MATTAFDILPGTTDHNSAPPTLRMLGARHTRYPEIGVAALDAMAAIAGPSWAPDYELAWSAAFENVTAAMRAASSEAAIRAKGTQ